jgi:glutaredoxin
MNEVYWLVITIILLVLYKLKCQHTRDSDVAKVKIYGSESCGYTVKMRNMINKSHYKYLFQYIDIHSHKGKQEYKKLDVTGVPAFQFKNKTVVGAMPVKVVLKKLNVI